MRSKKNSLKNRIKKDKVFQVAYRLFLEPHPESPNKHLYTLEKIKSEIKKKLNQDVGISTIQRQIKKVRDNGRSWEDEWNSLQVESSIEINKQTILTEKEKAKIEKERIKDNALITAEAKDIIITSKAIRLEKLDKRLDLINNKIDEIIAVPPDNRNVKLLEVLIKYADVLNKSILELTTVDIKYSAIRSRFPNEVDNQFKEIEVRFNSELKPE